MKLNTLFESHFSAVIALVYDEHANVLLGIANNNDDRKGKWCFPAGSVKPGECPGEAAVRECLEETGISAKPQQMAVPHWSKPEIGIVICRKVGGEFKPNFEFKELQWVPWNKVLELPNIYQDVEKAFSGISELMFP